MITDNQTNKIYFSPALERDCPIHMVTDTLLLFETQKKMAGKWEKRMNLFGI